MSISFDEKTCVEGNPSSIHTAEGNPENYLKATVNPKIGGLTHLRSRVRKYPGKVGFNRRISNPEKCSVNTLNYPGILGVIFFGNPENTRVEA